MDDNGLEIARMIEEKFGINIVTCGQCGGIFTHKLPYTKNELKCPYCKFESDPCDFPDFFY